jgi:amidohydrolase
MRQWTLSENILQQTVELRRSIHQHPELSNHELETTERLNEFLTSFGLEVKTFDGMYGLYVDIDAGADKWVVFRADIDALPIVEATGLSYASDQHGVMHACGHDFHAAIAAGLAVSLYECRQTLKVNIRIVFQPAEEDNPTGGSKRVIEQGVCDLPDLEGIYGLHLWPEYQVGTIALKSGAQMAASDKFNLSIIGRTAHAAEPHNGIDSILIGSKIVEAIIEGVRRRIDPKEMMNISIGTFHSEGRYNVISDHVSIEGTIRTFNEITRREVHTHLRNFVEKISSAYGAECNIQIQEGYPVLVNDEALSESFTTFIKGLGNEYCLVPLVVPSFIGEDFAYYRRCAPSMFMFLGCGSEYPLHSNRFSPDERVLSIGMKVMLNRFMSM